MSNDQKAAQGMKACPFCGGEAEKYLPSKDGLTGYSVACTSCWATTQDKDTLDEAVAAWNTRPTPPAQAGEVLDESDLREAAGYTGTEVPRTYSLMAEHREKSGRSRFDSVGSPKQAQAGTSDADAWRDTAEQMARDRDYYRGLVVSIGEMLGTEAYTADDGGIHLDVLCAKVPELVKAKLSAQAPVSGLSAESIEKWRASFKATYIERAHADLDAICDAALQPRSELKDEAINDFRMDELDAVMQTVDKWFDEGDPRLKLNPATRAAHAREIALRAIESKGA